MGNNIFQLRPSKDQWLQVLGFRNSSPLVLDEVTHPKTEGVQESQKLDFRLETGLQTNIQQGLALFTSTRLFLHHLTSNFALLQINGLLLRITTTLTQQKAKAIEYLHIYSCTIVKRCYQNHGMLLAYNSLFFFPCLCYILKQLPFIMIVQVLPHIISSQAGKLKMKVAQCTIS